MSHNYKNPQIWNTIWDRPYHNYEKHHQIFWNQIRKRAYGRVADLGCGSASCWRIPHPESIVDLYGCDFSPSAIREAKENCPWGHFQVADLTSLPYENSLYDTTILCGIVNYYKNLKPLLKEAMRITIFGGTVIITINVIDDFPNRHWDMERINKEFAKYGEIEAEFTEKIGWFIAITKN